MLLPWRLCGVLAFLAAVKDAGSSKNLCDDCTCKSDAAEIKSITVDCSRKLLVDIPPVNTWPPRASRLDLSYNSITVLPSLKSLELTHLDLQFNKIENITQGTFLSVRNLLYLNLSFNAIYEINELVFRGLEHLLIFRINDNSIKKIASNALYDFIELEELYMGGNPLKHLDVRLFRHLPNVRILDLSHTQLFALDNGIFMYMGRLSTLDLSNNDFHEVPLNALRSANKLTELSLNNNPITELTAKSFVKLNYVETLDLNYMPTLQRVGPETFASLPQLRILRLSSNKELKTIGDKAFHVPEKSTPSYLKEVDISYNNLAEIDGTMVSCRKLEVFDLQGNPWKCDCHMKWISNCSLPSHMTANLRCASPYKLKGVSMKSLTESDFQCLTYDGYDQREIFRIVILTIALLLSFCIGMAFVVLLRKGHIKCCRIFKKRSNASVYYVRAKS